MLSGSTLSSAGGLALSLVAMSASAAASSLAPSGGPCDIYASGGTKCVAAHSSTRALYSAYDGPLYQVIRASDQKLLNISTLSAGGIANAAAQDSFCKGTTCLISMIFDQSPQGNHLTQAPGSDHAAGADHGNDTLASAIGAPVALDGKPVYGIFIPSGTGYRNNHATGTAIGNASEGMYAVVDGTHYNGGCCWDYGNAENNTKDTGPGSMEAINFSNVTDNAGGVGPGPWVLADLESGIFSQAARTHNPKSPSISFRFVTALLKGRTDNQWAIRAGNATSGELSTFWSGQRPNGYQPMKLQGAIVLGVGGDNSNRGQGTFYEGVMTSGYPSDDTEAAVQANIVAAKYSTAPLNSGPALSLNSSVSFRATSPCCNTRYVTHNGTTVSTKVVNSTSDAALKRAASFTVRTGLGQRDCYSFESNDAPGSFIRHATFQLQLQPNDGTKQFAEDATYCIQPGLNGQGSTIRSWNLPTRFFRHFNGVLYAAANGIQNDLDFYDNPGSFNNDSSFVVSSGFA